MKEIKAIETVYNGYKFRSRLEARWAVFFDKMYIKYEYELEGFELKAGRYLPDFFLPELNLFVEIKPIDSKINLYDIERYVELGLHFDFSGLLLIIGSPSKQEFLIIDRYTCDHLDIIRGEYEESLSDEDLKKIWFKNIRAFGRAHFGMIPGNQGHRLIYSEPDCGYHTFYASQAAKQERFETKSL